MVAGLLVGIWVARYLGPERYGLLSYSIAFVAIFSGLSKMGLDSIVIRDLVQKPDQRDKYLGTAFWLKLSGAFVMLAVIALATRIAANDTTTNLYIFIIASGVLFQAYEVVDFYFQSKVLSKFVSISKIAQLLISSLIKLYLIFLHSDLIWFVFVSLIDQITLALSFMFAYRHLHIGVFFKHFDRLIAKQLLRDSWPLILSGLAIMLYMRIDQVMIKEMLGEKEVGLYSAAIRLSEIWYFVPIIITNSLFPSIINAKKVSNNLYYLRLQRLYTFLVWMGIAVALPVTFTSDWIITLLYGEAYKQAGEVLMISIWAGIFVALGVASARWFINEGLQIFQLYKTLLGAFINIALNFIFIPKYGIIGAAIATVLTQSIATLFFDLSTKKTRAVFFMKLRTLYFSGLMQRG